MTRIPKRCIEGEPVGHPLRTMALAQEAYIRLIHATQVRPLNRAQFFGVSANLMRRILVGYASSQNYLKRGGKARRVMLDGEASLSPGRAPDLIALDEALERLEAVDQRKSRAVELRFFGGPTADDTAEVLHLSPRTVLSDSSIAKSWLFRELTKSGNHEAAAREI
jgi:RNA polymerase sigma-70 factor (ECF subfamily)